MTQETEKGHCCAFLHDMYVALRVCNYFNEVYGTYCTPL